MQSLKIFFAFLLVSISSQAQYMNNSISGNRLSSFNVAHAGLDGNQVNFSGILNSKFGSNNSLLFETRLGKSNFSMSGILENNSGIYYSGGRKQLGLSYRFDLNNDKTLSFGLGYERLNSFAMSNIKPGHFLHNDYHVKRLGTVYGGKRFKIGVEFAHHSAASIAHSNFYSFNLIYHQNIINRENFQLNTNLVLSNFNSSLEAELLFRNKYSVVTGYDVKRGTYVGLGYKVSDNLELNLSTSQFTNYSPRPSIQFGLKFNF